MTPHRLRTWCRRAVSVAAIVLALDAASAAAQQIATVTVPPAVSFAATNISVATQGIPASFTISFINASGLTGGQRPNISVKAEASAFTPPAGGAGIPAAAVSWIATESQRGAGSSGTLSALAYSQVFRASNNAGSGSVTLDWRLSPLNANGLRAGPHTITVRWRLEAL